MDKTKIKYAIDLGLVVAFVLSFGTGLIKFPMIRQVLATARVVLPSHDINFIHDWAGISMGTLILLHLIFNFSWIIAMTKKYLGKKA
jgi:hypothetical protein